jgi:peptidoglycan/xylan/chitin deacetylase (PgdA/CDA1 family)
VSLTYDDGLNNQLDNALPQLAAFGVRATFFVTGENIQGRLADWKSIATTGHEVANHTVSHPCHLGRYSPERFRREEVTPMEQFLDANFGAARTRTFAYPCGETGLGSGSQIIQRARYAAMLSGTIIAARTAAGMPNDPRTLSLHRYGLHAIEPTYDHDDPSLAIRYLRWAITHGAWAILVFHGIVDRRARVGETSAKVHSEILDWISRHPLWCAPLGEVFDYVVSHNIN